MLPPAAVCIYKTVHFLFISYVNNWQIVGHCVLLYNTNFRSISSKTIIVFFHVTSLWTATWDAVQLVWKLSVLPSFTQCKHCCEMCEVNSCVCVCVSDLMMVCMPRTCGVLSRTLRVCGRGWAWWADARAALLPSSPARDTNRQEVINAVD